MKRLAMCMFAVIFTLALVACGENPKTFNGPNGDHITVSQGVVISTQASDADIDAYNQVVGKRAIVWYRNIDDMSLPYGQQDYTIGDSLNIPLEPGHYQVNIRSDDPFAQFEASAEFDVVQNQTTYLELELLISARVGEGVSATLTPRLVPDQVFYKNDLTVTGGPVGYVYMILAFGVDTAWDESLERNFDFEVDGDQVYEGCYLSSVKTGESFEAGNSSNGRISINAITQPGQEDFVLSCYVKTAGTATVFLSTFGGGGPLFASGFDQVFSDEITWGYPEKFTASLAPWSPSGQQIPGEDTLIMSIGIENIGEYSSVLKTMTFNVYGIDFNESNLYSDCHLRIPNTEFQWSGQGYQDTSTVYFDEINVGINPGEVKYYDLSCDTSAVPAERTVQVRFSRVSTEAQYVFVNDMIMWTGNFIDLRGGTLTY